MPYISPEPQKRCSQQSFPYLYSKFMKGQSDSALYASVYGVVFHAHSYSMILVYWNLLQKDIRFVLQILKILWYCEFCQKELRLRTMGFFPMLLNLDYRSDPVHSEVEMGFATNLWESRIVTYGFVYEQVLEVKEKKNPQSCIVFSRTSVLYNNFIFSLHPKGFWRKDFSTLFRREQLTLTSMGMFHPNY